MQDFLRRTWAQINLDAVNNNIQQIKSIMLPGAKLCAVVKADCYGHGYAHTAAEMSEAGADWFAVSNLSEALQLRRVGIIKPVLIMGYTPPDKAAQLVYNDISQAVFSREYAEALSENAVKNGVKVSAHIKIDTGMSRIGFLYHDSIDNYPVIDEIEDVCSLPGLVPEGIFTHFSSADLSDGEVFTRIQYDLFLSAVERLAARGIEFSIKHCSNSAAILEYPEMNLDMVRAGIILYGLYPSSSVCRRINLLPVMELKAVISMIKTVPPDTPVSYGRAYHSSGETVIATVPLGYADGYPRLCSNKTYMLVNGRRAKVLGNVCMDQTLIDVTGIPDVKAGSQITVFGSDNGAFLPVEELSKESGLINYELICALSRRVPRVYIKNNEIIETTDYML
ncbi:MAG: alanine racemase [Oscillospiraceae bacterium]|nr:alanine racemase [Oscillospiraceae bacterium]